jgi:polar amino acid transport system substrate-binding protein
LDKEKFLVIEYADEDIQNFKKLVNGRIDIFPLGLYVGKYFINRYFPTYKEKIKFSDKAMHEGEQYLISYKSQESREIMRRFNSGFKKLIESGRYEKIKNIYL